MYIIILYHSMITYYLGHQGWTDFLSQYSIYITFIQKQPPETLSVILIYNPQLYQFVHTLFVENTHLNISIEQVQTTNTPTRCCVVCHTPGEKICPRTPTSNCIFPDISCYSNFQGLCCFDNPSTWFPHIDNELHKGNSFVHAFYSYYSLPFETLWTNFNIILDVYRSTIHTTRYLTYHIIPDIIVTLPKDETVTYISLRDTFNDILSAIPYLQASKEIHSIPSVYAMLLYLLQLKFGLFQTTRIVIYTKNRDVDSPYRNLYHTPKLDNWTFL